MSGKVLILNRLHVKSSRIRTCRAVPWRFYNVSLKVERTKWKGRRLTDEASSARNVCSSIREAALGTNSDDCRSILHQSQRYIGLSNNVERTRAAASKD